MRWQKKLNKKEMKHLKDTVFGRPTLRSFKQNREAHRRARETRGEEPCWECRFIAIKLGLE